eukprot:6491414-Amphidinium_carterae.2
MRACEWLCLSEYTRTRSVRTRNTRTVSCASHRCFVDILVSPRITADLSGERAYRVLGGTWEFLRITSCAGPVVQIALKVLQIRVVTCIRVDRCCKGESD